MVGIVSSLETVLKGDNLERMAETMDKFEQQFETLDVQSVKPLPPVPQNSGAQVSAKPQAGLRAVQLCQQLPNDVPDAPFEQTVLAGSVLELNSRWSRHCDFRDPAWQAIVLPSGLIGVSVEAQLYPEVAGWWAAQGVVEAAMSQQAAQSTPEEEVNSLLQQVTSPPPPEHARTHAAPISPPAASSACRQLPQAPPPWLPRRLKQGSLTIAAPPRAKLLMLYY